MLDGQSPDPNAQQLFALQKCTFVLLGIIIWETFINLYYDWRLVRRQSWPWPPATWAYLISRLSVLSFVIIVGINPDLDCAVNLRVFYVLPYLVISTSSLLIAFRTMAVWSYDVRIVVIVLVGWLFELGLSLFTIIDINPRRIVIMTPSGALVHCENESTWRIIFNLALTFVYNTLLFVLTLIVLWRQRRASAHSLWRRLWTQGFVWLCLSSVILLPTIGVIATTSSGAFNACLSLI
ncbi:hypothetical protein PENSPDRAFT_27569 [Peniophora sp. CONT]|nr:hypothetical protein PENSPDRAFT_27569 [Peniophora sp. CONT]